MVSHSEQNEKSRDSLRPMDKRRLGDVIWAAAVMRQKPREGSESEARVLKGLE